MTVEVIDEEICPEMTVEEREAYDKQLRAELGKMYEDALAVCDVFSRDDIYPLESNQALIKR